MAELAVGIVGLAGLITVAESAFVRIHRFLKHVRKAEQQVNDLFCLITNLYGTLQGVERIVSDFNFGKLAAERYNASITHCSDLLNRISKKLEVFHDNRDSSSSRIKLSKRLKWPFSVEETEQMYKDVERYQAALGVSLISEGLAIGIETHAEISSVRDDVARIRDVLEDSLTLAMSEEQNRIISAVSSLSPWDQYRFNLRTRQQGTGIWFLESPEFTDWLRIDNSALWIYGIPGAGKSILASAAINKVLNMNAANDTVTAFFFCDYKRPDTHVPEALLRSLVQQIARQNEKCYERLESFVSKHCRKMGESRAQLSVSNQLRNLSFEIDDLEALLAQMAADLRQLVILVDGLDECGDNVRSIVQALKRISQCSPHVKMYLSSRDIPDIRKALGDWPSVSIAARSIDLLLFVGEQIKSRVEKGIPKQLDLDSESTKAEIMDALVKGAEGMFRWVTLQLDSICDLVGDQAIREQLKVLPIGIDASYERLLHDFNKKPPSTQLIIGRALKWIVNFGRIPPGVMGEALGVDPCTNLSPERPSWRSDASVLQLCSSFVRMNGGYLEPSHFTVKEFLSSSTVKQDPRLQQYAVDETADKKIFATTALSHLLRSEVSDVCDSYKACNTRVEQHPFRSFMLSLWPSWLRRSLKEPEVIDLVKKLFDPDSARGLKSWVVERAVEFMIENQYEDSEDEAKGMFTDIHGRLSRLSPLHLACMLNLRPIYRWLLNIGEDPDIRSVCGSALHCALMGDEMLYLDPGTTEDELFSFDREREWPEVSHEAVRVLIEHGVDVNQPLTYMRVDISPLHLAFNAVISGNDWDLVTGLLEAGAFFDRKLINRLTDWIDDDENDESGDIRKFLGEVQPASVRTSDKLAFQGLLDVCIASQHADEKGLADDASGEDIAEALEDSIAANDARTTEDLMTKFNVPANWRNESGESPLDMAATFGSSSIVAVLIRRGISLNETDAHGRTALHIALRWAHGRFVQSLYEHGAACTAIDDDGRTAWHYTAGCQANENVDVDSRIDCFNILKGFGGAVDLIDRVDKTGRSPLMITAENGQDDLFELFIKLGADEWRHDNEGRSLLHFAATAAHDKLVCKLISRGHKVQQTDSQGRCALHYAAVTAELSTKVFTTIYEAAPEQLSSDVSGTTALDALFLTYFDLKRKSRSAKERQEVAQVLAMLAKQVDDSMAIELFSRLTPVIGHYESLADIFWDLAQRNFSVVDELPLCARVVALLEDSRPGFRSENQDKIICSSILKISTETLKSLRVCRQQVFSRAVHLKRDRICNAILDRYVDFNTKDEDENRFNMLQTICCSQISEATAKRVLSEAGDLEFASLTTEKRSLLHLAARSGSVAVLNYLLDHGQDPNAKDLQMRTPLHYAAMRRDGLQERVVADLLEEEASPCLKDNWDFSAAHHAALAGNDGVLRILEHEKICWVDTCTYDFPWFSISGLSLLHISAISGSVTCFLYLLEFNELFDITRKARSHTVMSLASLKGRTDLVRTLAALRQDWTTLEQPQLSLYNAVFHNNREIVRILLNAGYNPLAFIAGRSSSPLQLARMRRYFDLVPLLHVATNPKQIASGSSSIILDAAIKDGDKGKIDKIISHDIKVLAQTGPCGCDLLLLSIHHGKPEISSMLLAHGVRTTGLSCALPIHAPGEGALQLCARKNDLDTMVTILHSSPWLLFVNYEIHPIHLAIYNRAQKCLTYMLDNYVQLSEQVLPGFAQGESGPATPLQAHTSQILDKDIAARKYALLDSHDIRFVRLSRSPTSRSSLSPNHLLTNLPRAHMLPVHSAVAASNYLAVESLAKAGTDIDSIDPPSSCTALSLAIKRRDLKMTKLLLSLGADPYACNAEGLSSAQMLVASKFPRGSEAQTWLRNARYGPPTDFQARPTPLYFAGASPGIADFTFTLHSTLDLLEPRGGGCVPWSLRSWQYLFHACMDLSVCSPSCGSIIHRYWLNAEHLKDHSGLLLRRICRRLGPTLTKSFVNTRPTSCFTPLYTATIVNTCVGIKILLQYGADIDMPGGTVGSSVMAACVYGRLEALKLLVYEGASLVYTDVDDDGNNVTHSALEKARLFPKLQRWLLVERWTERKRISC